MNNFDALLTLLLPVLVVVGCLRALSWQPRRRVPQTVIILAPDRVPSMAGDGLPADPRDRFEAVAAAYGRTDEDLARQLRATWWRFAIAFNGAVLLLAYAIAMEPLAVLVAILAGLQAVRAAVEHWTVRTRSLPGIGAFLLTPREWWPPSPYTDEPRAPAARRRLTAADRWFLLRQLPRRAWCLLRGAPPPAPPGTPRLTHEPAVHLPTGGRNHG